MAHVDDLIEHRPQQVLLTVVSRSSHARPQTPFTAMRESRTAKNRNPKTQETEAQRPLSCKISYSMRPTCAGAAARSAFFTDDEIRAIMHKPPPILSEHDDLGTRFLSSVFAPNCNRFGSKLDAQCSQPAWSR
jgi:hypothetical protein